MKYPPYDYRLAIALLMLAGWGMPRHVLAQDVTGLIPTATIHMTSLDTAPKVDGIIGASEWANAAVVDRPFVQFEPEFGVPSSFRTVVRIGQTDTALFVAFEAYDPDIGHLAAARTQRDRELGGDDSVAVLLDTFADQRTGYLFRTNVLATQQDVRLADNGRTQDKRWDTEWYSAATRHVDHWTVEFEIPFSSLKVAWVF
jgi:hypothetical protein